MIKKTLAISLFIILSFAITAQTFEGKIKYKAEKLMPSGNIICIVDIFVKANKSRMEMSINDTKLSSYSLVVGKETYHVPEFEEIIRKEKKHKSNEHESELKRLKKKCSILGYSCTQYKKKRNTPYGQEIVIYEVADSLKVDSLNNFGRIINGKIVLRNTLITENDTYIEEAIELKETPLPDSLFILPDYPIIEVNFEKLSKKYIKEAGY
jgi:hypothetical protein